MNLKSVDYILQEAVIGALKNRVEAGCKELSLYLFHLRVFFLFLSPFTFKTKKKIK